ncbi:hypothetical protein H4W80_001538 [Nonomuraea angiospora]|uniref:Uncharacterized protein n=1 Tax=Nonomuraea angiospora TaxID=46172 RepID=A0ABR9LRJ1_9ACTN|nr:hypothetical protein [Nonomuraea angiospora]
MASMKLTEAGSRGSPWISSPAKTANWCHQPLS